jgi:hypothetical protein
MMADLGLRGKIKGKRARGGAALRVKIIGAMVV